MKYTGTIEIECGELSCDDCSNIKKESDLCEYFDEELHYSYDIGLVRCSRCLETFKPEISEGKVRQIMAGGSGIGLLEEALNKHRKIVEGE